AQEAFCNQRRAGIAAELVAGVQRRNDIEVRLDQVVRGPARACPPNPLDALTPLIAPRCLGTAQVVPPRPRVRIDDTKGCGLEAQVQQKTHQHAVFVHIGKITGMKSVAIIHEPPKARSATPAPDETRMHEGFLIRSCSSDAPSLSSSMPEDVRARISK